jgi:hypothetical protein
MNIFSEILCLGKEEPEAPSVELEYNYNGRLVGLWRNMVEPLSLVLASISTESTNSNLKVLFRVISTL